MIKFNDLPVYELQVPDEDGGVYAISLVDRPATETEWLAFSEDTKVDEVKFSLNSDKQILTAPLMLANSPIYRKDKYNGEHYIVFTEATLEKMSINFFKNNVRDFNEMHDSSFGIDNATVIESWIKTSETDKSKELGFGDAPVGSWFISVFIDDKEFWDENIKTGKFKGFSLEGLFEKVQLSSDVQEEEFDCKCGRDYDGDCKCDEEEFVDTYNDYPDSAVNNAKRGIELNKENNNKCATQVGKTRGQDIANRRGLSFDVIKRTFSYLSRAEEDYDGGDPNACGTISYLLWGGKTMKSWAEAKIKSIEKEKLSFDEELNDNENNEMKDFINKLSEVVTSDINKAQLIDELKKLL